MSKEHEGPEDQEEPEEPDFGQYESEMDLTPLDEDAFQMFAMFESLLRAGFRERQALFLVGIIINEAHEDEIYYTTKVDDDDDDDEEDQANGVK